MWRKDAAEVGFDCSKQQRQINCYVPGGGQRTDTAVSGLTARQIGQGQWHRDRAAWCPKQRPVRPGRGTVQVVSVAARALSCSRLWDLGCSQGAWLSRGVLLGELVGLSSCWLGVRRQQCRVEETTGRNWQREDACFELSRLQGIEGDNRLDEILWWSGVVCGGRGQEQRGRQAELGTWPWWESGVGVMARGRGLAPRACPGFWCLWCRIVLVLVPVLVDFLSPLVRVVIACCKVDSALCAYVCVCARECELCKSR